METTALEVTTLEASGVSEAMAVLEVTYGAASVRGNRAPMAADPAAWLIARRNGAAAGVVTANVYGRAAYVAMLAVDPLHRRAGVATRLMETLLARLRAGGTQSVLLDATAQAESLYARLGFVEIDRTLIFARNAPAPHGDSAPGVDAATLRRVRALDARFYGCDRDAALRRFATGPYAFAVTGADGYALAHGPVLGPFAAERTAVAERILARVLARRPHLERAFAPAANRDAPALYAAHGFDCARTLAHMAYGAPSPFRRERIFSQASLGHG